MLINDSMTEVEYLKFILEGLVHKKDKIEIEHKVDELGTLLSIKVDSDDMGILIGKSWSTIQSLRTVMRMHWLNVGKKIHLKVIE